MNGPNGKPESVTEYADHVAALQKPIADMGEPQSSEDQLATALSGLDPRFEGVQDLTRELDRDRIRVVQILIARKEEMNLSKNANNHNIQRKRHH